MTSQEPHSPGDTRDTGPATAAEAREGLPVPRQRRGIVSLATVASHNLSPLLAAGATLFVVSAIWAVVSGYRVDATGTSLNGPETVLIWGGLGVGTLAVVASLWSANKGDA